jgi:hypothetical protein
VNIPYENVKALISQGEFGHYVLFSLPGNEQIGGSHLSSGKGDGEQKISSADLLAHLDTVINNVGAGQYKIVLKKTSLSNNGGVTYRFYVKGENEEKNATGSYLGYVPDGLKMKDIDERVADSVTKALAAEREKFNLLLENFKLQQELAEVKKKKSASGTDLKWVKELAGLGKMGLVLFASANYPEAAKALAAMAEEEEEEEDEEENDYQPKQRPN